MAVSTATTLASTFIADRLAEMVINAGSPKRVVTQLSHKDSLVGTGNTVFKVPVFTDLGSASAATEGTDIAASTTLSMGTQLSITPTEYAEYATITDDAVEVAFGGRFANVSDLVTNAPTDVALRFFMREAMRLEQMMANAIEDAHIGLLGGFSATAGTSNTDLGVDDILSALYQIEAAEALNDDYVLALTPNQVHELRLEALATSGGYAGSLWMAQAEASALVKHQRDAAMNGLKGGLLGVPVYQISNSLKDTANAGADVVGALLCRGEGSVETAFDGRVGALGMVNGRDLRFRFERDEVKRATNIVMSAKWAVAELADKNGVSIITDAP